MQKRTKDHSKILAERIIREAISEIVLDIKDSEEYMRVADLIENVRIELHWGR